MYNNNMIFIKRIEKWIIILIIILIYILILKILKWYISNKKNLYFYKKDEKGNLVKFFDIDVNILIRWSFKEK